MSISVAPNLDQKSRTIAVKFRGVRGKFVGLFRRRFPKPAAFWIQVIAASVICFLIFLEADQSYLRSLFFTQLASDTSFRVEPGTSQAIMFPSAGPYDRRLGYVALPFFVQRLEHRHFVVERQARQSSAMRKFMKAGGYAVYREKLQAGLVLRGQSGMPLEIAHYPSIAYRRLSEIPSILVNTLRFIEDREILDRNRPYRNPAIDWHRFTIAAARRMLGALDGRPTRGGASTLATQIEKFRHSPYGRTENIAQKLHQMETATLRAYLNGPNTLSAQRRIVTAYFDSTPLGSRPGYGEVIGLGDGLSAWYGIKFAVANRLLASRALPTSEAARRAQIYKEALSLLIAQRRPAFYLNGGRKDLERLTDTYLRRLGAAGIIDRPLTVTAIKLPLAFAAAPPAPPTASFVTRKAVDAVRTELMTLLDVPSLYDLDRLDLAADVSIDTAAQSHVATFLEHLKNPRTDAALGLVGDQLLGTADPAKVTWSVVLYERMKGRNLVRIHADSLNRPFDINSGAKLILGSTAKLRTLATYLGIMDRLHGELSTRTVPALLQIATTTADPLRRWAANYLATASPDRRGLEAMLDAAMQRHYSGNPAEVFFTGGGIQTFSNFERKEDVENPTVEEAFEHSINLAFVRLMRDVIEHYELEGGARKQILDVSESPAREAYLRRFADQEGRLYLNRFYTNYAGLSPDAALDQLASHVRPAPRQLAVLYRSARPRASAADLQRFLEQRLQGVPVPTATLYSDYAPERFSLVDRAYLIGIHPLELWLVAYLQHHPRATRSQVISASVRQRQEAYDWLFKTRNVHKQNVRIRELIEEDAFGRLLEDWQRQGYPFDHLVPSLGTVLGSSGDRPDALAKLMGIILAGGVRQPTVDIERLHFASGTPFDTEMAYKPPPRERIMAPQVAAILRRALAGVVENGTGLRVRGTYVEPNGALLPIGGKTGTGDNRFKVFGPGHQLIESRAVDRTATFVFFLGRRFYGTITAYVYGEQASQYHFTSALAVSLLKALKPELYPLLVPVKVETHAESTTTRPSVVPR
ncbi:MAG: transglycosylase domain-containing protein [Alphaproteobacteria bacterium]|nr:transglycosylase domain-containing protein [Alphaproteobacteria bacterium]